MKEPEFPKYSRRFVSMSMSDKYMAICFIYDGIQYQNLCKEENPDGTFNISEKCLARLPQALHSIGYDTNTSLNDERGLVKFDSSEQAVDFPSVVSALTHYWREVFILCLLSAIVINLIFALIGRRHAPLLTKVSKFLGLSYFSPAQTYSRFSATPTIDSEGTITIGKISFDPKKVLGYGSKGTCVFRGSFENSQDCAVKRVVSQYLTLADREVDFLRSLQHPNLVRYLATEEDAQFIYISLELAEFTLGELIETGRIAELGLVKEELCRQAALGLQHLHKLDIVHRDIKPQNILVSFPLRPNNARKVMISDFGLSKQLSNLDTGHTSSVMKYFDGTQGWMAPEIVSAKIEEDKTLAPSKAADIFSLGCVFYYIIFEGRHLFGRADQRQHNILKNVSMLDSFSVKTDDETALEILARKLVGEMINPDPCARPSINVVLKYPLFWSRSDQLQFLQDVSDKIDQLTRDNDLVRRIESNKQKIFAFGWKDILDKFLLTDIEKQRTYNSRSVRDLLRAIRNKKHHYVDLSPESKKVVGTVPDGYMNYFASKFPELLPHVYHAVQNQKHDTIFSSYYEQIDEHDFAIRTRPDQFNQSPVHKKDLEIQSTVTDN